MKVAGSAVIGVKRDRVWAALQDPAVLVRTIPGCERLEETAADTYRMTVNAGVASIKGVYQGEVALADQREPDSFVLRARGQGAPGTVDATVVVRLAEVNGGTRVDYDADAVIGGMIGGVGQRMLGSVARRTANEFFAAVERQLTIPPQQPTPLNGTIPTAGAAFPVAGGQAVNIPGAGAPGAASASVVEGSGVGAEFGSGGVGLAARAVYERPVYERPAGERPARQRTQTRPWVMLAAFGMGAGIALTGVAVGWLLGRTSRR